MAFLVQSLWIVAVLLANHVAVSASRVAHSVSALPEVVANDNRLPAGKLEKGVLKVSLAVQMARWHPEAPDGPFADVAAWSEEGHEPQIPGPLIRVPAGTVVEATIRNGLADSTLWVHGMATRPETGDSVAIVPGASRTVRFAAGRPGTYMYFADAGKIDYANHEREQLAAAFVIDPPGWRLNDRIFVINIWGDAVGKEYRNALAINGKSWPYTERITATTGDTMSWRIINASTRGHPMHLHGFYFRVEAMGSYLADTAFRRADRRLAVTQQMAERSTMLVRWSPSRAGNWLFHCHVAFHVVSAAARLDPPAGDGHSHGDDPREHMAGLVMGITVNQRAGSAALSPSPTQSVNRLRLFADERPRTGRTPLSMSYVLQRDRSEPRSDSTEPPGAVIVLHRGEPTEITIVNRAHDATSVHWHGLELLSFNDGVAGWSGAAGRLAPMIAPRDSFTAHLALPRAGTFIYHTHLNDMEQLTSGMYGALVVLEPGERFDPATDHVFVTGWDGDSPHLMINGDSTAAPLKVAFGHRHRFRFVNIGAADKIVVAIRRDTIPAQWQPLAKDGADLPKNQRAARSAIFLLDVGETFDAEFNAPARGEYVLTIGLKRTPMAYTRRLIVK